MARLQFYCSSPRTEYWHSILTALDKECDYQDSASGKPYRGETSTHGYLSFEVTNEEIPRALLYVNGMSPPVSRIKLLP